MPNRLALERSPYLLQHADNPVDWYPWGAEALEKARREGKPIFLSIGYAACHWCHVMAHESFADPEVAAILNAHFVSIKVDREERPDIDRIYMSAVVAMTGQGGWPLSVFLTPEGQPFYGGTYFPPVPRHGLPSFRQVLLGVLDAWENRREEVLAGGQAVQRALEQGLVPVATAEAPRLDEETQIKALRNLQRAFDPVHGGWGGAPRFPSAQTIAFLLRVHARTGDPEALAMATRTLEAMARGGIYDQIGGGFHRYAVDARWQVPHFEKMLYDQALLARACVQAWLCTGRPLFREVAEETLDFVAREMTDPAGGFYSSLDADSEGQEGKFYLWQEEEIRALLGPEAERFLRAYGVTAGGNFEGANILTLVGPYEERAALAPARAILRAAREARVRPARDEKVLASWNGLMLAAFAEAARVLGRADYRAVAERNAAFLLEEMRRADGRLWHTWIDGRAAVPGLLDDYCHVIDGWLELYRTTFDAALYQAAREAMEVVLAHFSAPEGGFFDTSDEHEALIVRPRELQDSSIPSGNAMAALDLLRLARLAVEPAYAELARRAIAPMQPLLAAYPLGFSHWLLALEEALATPVDVAIVGAPDAPDTQRLLAVCRQGYRPNLLVALGAPGEERVPLLRGRTVREGRAQAYVCRGETCLPPTGDPEELARLLEGWTELR